MLQGLSRKASRSAVKTGTSCARAQWNFDERLRYSRLMFSGLPTSGLVILIGAPASGKSTFAALAFAPRDVIALDDLKSLSGGSPEALHATPAAIDLLCALIRHRLNYIVFSDQSGEERRY